MRRCRAAGSVTRRGPPAAPPPCASRRRLTSSFRSAMAPPALLCVYQRCGRQGGCERVVEGQRARRRKRRRAAVGRPCAQAGPGSSPQLYSSRIHLERLAAPEGADRGWPNPAGAGRARSVPLLGLSDGDSDGYITCLRTQLDAFPLPPREVQSAPPPLHTRLVDRLNIHRTEIVWPHPLLALPGWLCHAAIVAAAAASPTPQHCSRGSSHSCTSPFHHVVLQARMPHFVWQQALYASSNQKLRLSNKGGPCTAGMATHATAGTQAQERLSPAAR